LMKWLGGSSVRLTGEEAAPLALVRGERKRPIEQEWSRQTKGTMRQLRQSGLSRTEIADRLSIPREYAMNIQRVAPLSKEQRDEVKNFHAEQKEQWGYKRRLVRAIREKRRQYW